jgi:hypothetical protein
MDPRMTKITEIAERLGVADPSWLWSLIMLESGMDPLKKNPRSSARGLIQIMDATARDVFKMPDSLTLINQYPDFYSQMDNVVYPYLKRYAGYPTKQSLYMAVFFPVARFVPPDTSFNYLYESHAIGGEQWPEKLAQFHAQNPGIDTVQDYIDRADNSFRGAVAAAGAGLTGLAVAIGAYFLFRGHP